VLKIEAVRGDTCYTPSSQWEHVQTRRRHRPGPLPHVTHTALYEASMATTVHYGAGCVRVCLGCTRREEAVPPLPGNQIAFTMHGSHRHLEHEETCDA